MADSTPLTPSDSPDDFQQGIVPIEGDLNAPHDDQHGSAGTLPEIPQLTPFTLPSLHEMETRPPKQPADFLQDVELKLNVELGRTKMALEEVRRLGSGVVVTLDRRTGEPVDVVVNGQLVARGEVIVLEGKLCVRVNEIVTGDAA